MDRPITRPAPLEASSRHWAAASGADGHHLQAVPPHGGQGLLFQRGHPGVQAALQPPEGLQQGRPQLGGHLGERGLREEDPSQHRGHGQGGHVAHGAEPLEAGRGQQRRVAGVGHAGLQAGQQVVDRQAEGVEAQAAPDLHELRVVARHGQLEPAQVIGPDHGLPGEEMHPPRLGQGRQHVALAGEHPDVAAPSRPPAAGPARPRRAPGRAR